MNRWRVEEQVEKLTAMLRDQKSLPSSLYGFLHENGVDPAQTVLTDFTED